MDNYLAHVKPGSKPAKVREALSDLSKEDLTETAVQLFAQKAAASAKVQLGGSLSGITLGEAINLGLLKYGSSTYPGAALVRDWFTWLRTVPHLALGLLGVMKYSDQATPGRAFGMSTSIGLLGPAAARIIDKVLMESDIDAATADTMQAQIDALKAENAKLRGGATP